MATQWPLCLDAETHRRSKGEDLKDPITRGKGSGNLTSRIRQQQVIRNAWYCCL